MSKVRSRVDTRETFREERLVPTLLLFDSNQSKEGHLSTRCLSVGFQSLASRQALICSAIIK